MQVRDWYVESFKDLRSFPKVKDTQSEREFTSMLHHIYNRHRNVVPVMAMGVAELKQQLAEEVEFLAPCTRLPWARWRVHFACAY